MTTKRADQVAAGDVLPDQRTITSVAPLGDGLFDITFSDGTTVRYSGAYQFGLEDPEWERVTLRVLSRNTDVRVVRTATLLTIAAVRQQMGITDPIAGVD